MLLKLLKLKIIKKIPTKIIGTLINGVSTKKSFKSNKYSPGANFLNTKAVK